MTRLKYCGTSGAEYTVRPFCLWPDAGLNRELPYHSRFQVEFLRSAHFEILVELFSLADRASSLVLVVVRLGQGPRWRHLRQHRVGLVPKIKIIFSSKTIIFDTLIPKINNAKINLWTDIKSYR